jgi:hypothetical protein
MVARPLIFTAHGDKAVIVARTARAKICNGPGERKTFY